MRLASCRHLRRPRPWPSLRPQWGIRCRHSSSGSISKSPTVDSATEARRCPLLTPPTASATAVGCWRSTWGRSIPNHPPSVVPLLAWGCAIWSLVDYSTPEGRMWGWDPNQHCPDQGHALFSEDLTLAERLCGGWTDGRTSRRRPLARTAQIAETAALQCGCIPVTTPPGSLARLTGQPKRPAH
jgi:hypothetical protein